MTIFEQLSAPFPPAQVHWRVGSTKQDKSAGLALAYLDARDVMERLDAVVGPASWQCRYPHANGKTVCEIGIKIGDEWIWKADGSGDTDVEAEKGALSDAFKRAGVRWGIGRYLYDLGNIWVDIEPMGKSYKIAKKDLDGKLLRSLPNAPAPAKTELQPPTDQGVDESKTKYIATCKEIIRTHAGDYKHLVTWWNEEKNSRRDFDLNQAEVDDLKAELAKRAPKQAEAA